MKKINVFVSENYHDRYINDVDIHFDYPPHREPIKYKCTRRYRIFEIISKIIDNTNEDFEITVRTGLAVTPRSTKDEIAEYVRHCNPKATFIVRL